MEDEQQANIDMLTFAMLGAYHSGQGHAAQDTRVGAKFRGSMPAAAAVGITRSKADSDPHWRAIYSMFTSGYLDYLKGGDLYTNDEGIVVQFKRRADWKR